MGMMNLDATDYLKRANAIAKTYAENSLKLIALKYLLESYLKKQTQEMILSEESIEIMTLMDELL
jgi:phycocyanobilin lyase alpha subunit